MSIGLEYLLFHLVAQKEQHLSSIQLWMDDADWTDTSHLRYHEAALYRVEKEVERVLNLLERD